jgi:hypothetical protein
LGELAALLLGTLTSPQSPASNGKSNRNSTMNNNPATANLKIHSPQNLIANIKH